MTADGYRVQPARSEEDAVERGRWHAPDLILVSLAGPDEVAIASARRIRSGAGLDDEVPVVIFGVQTIDEGAEVAAGTSVYLSRPDNFDQLRGLLDRLLDGIARRA